MFDDKTCLVLGAGASRPYGFPTSNELRLLLLGDSNVNSVFDALGFEVNQAAATNLERLMIDSADGHRENLRKFRRIFGESERVSIDSFIAGLPETQENAMLKRIAHRAVASVILFCEGRARPQGDWYQWLLEFLLRSGPNFAAKRLSVVTFNYDRSLEVYLWRAFMRSFNLTPTEARQMLERIDFFHVYGWLGEPLLDSSTNAVEYGSLDGIEAAAKNLSLASPRTLPERIEQVRTVLNASERVIFLGFGFWKENLDALFNQDNGRIIARESIPHLPSDDWFRKRIFASCYKLWRSVKIDVDAKIGFVHSHAQTEPYPHVNWGRDDQTIWQFVTHWNLKG